MLYIHCPNEWLISEVLQLRNAVLLVLGKLTKATEKVQSFDFFNYGVSAGFMLGEFLKKRDYEIIDVLLDALIQLLNQFNLFENVLRGESVEVFAVRRKAEVGVGALFFH